MLTKLSNCNPLYWGLYFFCSFFPNLLQWVVDFDIFVSSVMTLNIKQAPTGDDKPNQWRTTMNDVRMFYDEVRGTWNVFNGAEWYFESEDYEQAERVFESFFWQDDDNYEEEAW